MENMAVAQSLVRPFRLSIQQQQWTASSSNCGAAARQRTQSFCLSALKASCNATSIVEKLMRQQERRARRSESFRSGRRKAQLVRASSSAGALVSDWGQGGEEGRNAEEATNEVVKEVEKKRRRVIAGVDQTQLLEPHLLADPDSRFAEYYDVQIHHKIAYPSAVPDVHSPSSSSSTSSSSFSSSPAPAAPAPSAPAVADADSQRVNLPAILLHGFGASLFSWERVMPKLAEVLGAPALAFDRPAFGFTSRPFPPSSSSSSSSSSTSATKDTKESLEKYKNAYTIAFSAAATLAFIDFLKSDQAIVIGHSAGSLVAVDAYFQSPEKIAALILVAPAVIAPLLVQQIAVAKKATRKEGEEAVEKEIELEGEIEQETADPLSKFRASLLWVWVKFTSLLRAVKKFVQLVFETLLRFLFRSPPAIWVVQRIMDKGGPWAVRYAFYDVVKADQYVLDGYTRPLKCRDWERALLEYCLALMDNTEDQTSGKKKLEDVKCPVLVVTGDTDRIVPDWNSENMAKVFPNAEFKRIENCGHLPHEETPDEFLDIIKDWLSRSLIKETTNSPEPAMMSS